MTSKNFSIVFNIVGVIWVGGWGFLMFRYPEFFAKFNARFGFGMFTSPRFIAFTKWLGIVEMTLAGLWVISVIVAHALGLKWY